jgi:acyl-CoA thioesterase FadM
MIASLLDCHGAATAAAAKARDSGEAVGRFVTASLTVDFAKPTPLGMELEIRGKVLEIKGRKVTVDLRLLAGPTVCATGKVLMIQLTRSAARPPA